MARVFAFFEKILRHPKERFSPFLLLDWQKEFLREIFGRVGRDGLRQVRRCYLEVGKKNGKSELAAGIALFMLVADGEPAAEVYLAATVREQAGIVFRACAGMVMGSPTLRSRLKVVRSTKTIVMKDNPNCFLRAISADGDAQDGINPSAVIIDELHRWRTSKSRELFDVLTKGTVARREPLVVEITTSGSTEDESPIAWLEHERVRLLEAGHFGDPTFYGKVYGVDRKSDWTDPEVWKRANPSLETNGVDRKGFLKVAALQAECQAALNQPSLQAAFKRYHLGIWMSTETEWMPRDVWMANGNPLRPLVERPCYLGLDLSETTDLTSLVCLFPDSEDGTADLAATFWMAEERVRERELADRVPYSTWASEGLLTLTDGNVIDLRDIKKKIAWCAEVFNIRELAFDPHHALQLSIELTDELGIKCVPVPQRYTHMSEPTKKLLELALQKKIRHANNPILGWNMDCLRVKADGSDNVKPVKPDRFKEGKRIDGAIATILALSRAMFHKGSVYDKRGLVVAS